MPKVRKQENSRPILKFFIFLVLAILLGIFISYKSIEFLKKSRYFKIKLITVDQSLQFIEAQELNKLKGKNIFNVDLDKFQKSLNDKYPQIDQLKIVRRFPNQIKLTALKRSPIGQVQLAGHLITVDEKGFVLEYNPKKDDQLPYIKGIKLGNQKIKVGFLIVIEELKSAIEIVKTIKQNELVSSYQLQEVDMTQLSKIELKFTKELNVIIDTERIPYKIKVLEVVLTQGNVNFKETKYIDLRFKEPILGTK